MFRISVGELNMGYQSATFLHSEGSFTPHFLKIVFEFKASGLPHIFKLWFG